jgi:hypothetical protein
MQATSKPIDLQVVKNECASRIDSFFKKFRIASIARNSQIKKIKRILCCIHPSKHFYTSVHWKKYLSECCHQS